MDPNNTNLDLGPALPRTAIAAAMEEERYEVRLPSGATAQILKRGKGKHIELASRMAGESGGMRFIFAMIAVKARIEGRALQIEDVEDLPDLDVLALMGYVLGQNVAALGGLRAPKGS